MSSENITSALPVGYMLQNYRIERALGRGGFGITYLATENITGRKVVIKENYPRGVATRESANYGVRAVDADNKEMFDWALGSFVAEARVLTGLRHPHIVQVLTAFEALGTAYYVMDYIGGNSLSKMRPADITEQRLLDILRPILSALSYIHTLPEMLLHRDIKSDNILITPEGTPVLIDFGAARAVISNKTQTKIGTVGYAPPEQWASGAVRGPWTDLYALGATCYYLLTGKNPPDCHDRLFADPGSDLLAKSAKLQQTFTPELLASIDKAFALRPTDRWQSAQEWLAAISPKQAAQAAPTIPAPETINLSPKNSEQAPSPAEKKRTPQKELKRLKITAAQYNEKLLDAARDGVTELLLLLIEAGANILFTDKDGRSPLYKAAWNGRTECVRALLSMPNINVNQADKYGYTPLYQAACSNHTECVKLLLAAPGIDVNKANKDGKTPLSVAKSEQIKQLLRNKGAKYATSPKQAAQEELKRAGITAAQYNEKLLYAAEKGDKNLLSLLVTAGANINHADKYGCTPLYQAASNAHADCVKLLLTVPGVDVNKANNDGCTPLFWAANKSLSECVKLLIAAGADATKANKYGTTPFNATQSKIIKKQLLTKQTAQAELRLLEISEDKYDKTLLNAAKEGNTELINLLIAAGADVNKVHGWWIFSDTPLTGAAVNGKAESIKCLLQAPGIDVHKMDKTGSTALYWAAYHGYTECVKILLSHPNIDVNKIGAVTLRVAKNKEIKQLLREAGVKE